MCWTDCYAVCHARRISHCPLQKVLRACCQSISYPLRVLNVLYIIRLVDYVTWYTVHRCSLSLLMYCGVHACVHACVHARGGVGHDHVLCYNGWINEMPFWMCTQVVSRNQILGTGSPGERVIFKGGGHLSEFSVYQYLLNLHADTQW